MKKNHLQSEMKISSFILNIRFLKTYEDLTKVKKYMQTKLDFVSADKFNF